MATKRPKKATRAELETVMPGTKSLLERHEWTKHGSCYPADAETYFKDSIRSMEVCDSAKSHRGPWPPG